MPKVFISHSSKDRQFVNNDLVPLLRSHGVETWHSIEDIQSADDWEKRIREGLRSCDWFLVVLSPNAVASDWVQAEVHWAMDNRKTRIIPVLLAVCNSEELHLKLIRIQYVDFVGDRERAIQNLLATLGLGRNEVATTQCVLQLDLPTIERKMSGPEIYTYMQTICTKDRVALWSRAADEGLPLAQWLMAYCHNHGFCVKKDMNEAIRLYRIAADRGLSLAQHVVGSYYMAVSQDAEALSWFRKAAEQGAAYSAHMLGVFYISGKGVRPDHAEAVKWFRTAAEQGDRHAQYQLAKCYFKGLGVSKDENEGHIWLRKAVDQGNAAAQFYLGLCYLGGRGTAKDVSEGLKWVGLAAQQGDTDAIKMLAQLASPQGPQLQTQSDAIA